MPTGVYREVANKWQTHSQDVPLLSMSMSSFVFTSEGQRSWNNASIFAVSYLSLSLSWSVTTSLQSSPQYHHPSISLAYLGFFCRLTYLPKNLYRHTGPWSCGWKTAAFFYSQWFRTPLSVPTWWCNNSLILASERFIITHCHYYQCNHYTPFIFSLYLL